LLSLAAAAVLTFISHSVISILAATAVITVLALYFQLGRLKQLLHAETLLPAFDPEATRALFRFGIFSWLMAVSGVIFSQADKLIGGATLGAVAVASYALCAQMAQPIYGLTASWLHFLFPYLSGRRVTASQTALRRSVIMALAANIAFVLLSTFGLLLVGNRILFAWGGEAIARSGSSLLPVLAWSSALLALNVTGSYAMLALGRVLTITWLNLFAGATMMVLIYELLPRLGMSGIADARVAYGLITLLIYIPMAFLLRPNTKEAAKITARVPLREEA